jgi:hypothetical protein
MEPGKASPHSDNQPITRQGISPVKSHQNWNIRSLHENREFRFPADQKHLYHCLMARLAVKSLAQRNDLNDSPVPEHTGNHRPESGHATR